uniref:Large ribosomal subunit protein bL31 n=1 Tax=Candidatus Aschnera chinzeii TaxID=1485666 RepID=A0AAT9G4V1_9ENTR|nr:MAG: 50S ribosomal protein L31 [Candidatus Aschnera chinzeii]
MKDNIHPNYQKIIAVCSCGNTMTIKSTITNNINLDVCSKCHPFYTGKQRDIISKGRVSRFKRQYNLNITANNNKKNKNI